MEAVGDMDTLGLTQVVFELAMTKNRSDCAAMSLGSASAGDAWSTYHPSGTSTAGQLNSPAASKVRFVISRETTVEGCCRRIRGVLSAYGGV